MTPAERVAKWRRDNPEKAKAGRKRIYHNNLERERASRRRSGMKRLYGITPEQWDEIFRRQGSRCAVCKSTDPGTNKGWHTDHDHATNQVRGIVCFPCNAMLGKSKESIPRIRAMLHYLERHNVT